MSPNPRARTLCDKCLDITDLHPRRRRSRAERTLLCWRCHTQKISCFSVVNYDSEDGCTRAGASDSLCASSRIRARAGSRFGARASAFSRTKSALTGTARDGTGRATRTAVPRLVRRFRGFDGSTADAGVVARGWDLPESRRRSNSPGIGDWWLRTLRGRIRLRFGRARVFEERRTDRSERLESDVP
jgi:hypothetical protein